MRYFLLFAVLGLALGGCGKEELSDSPFQASKPLFTLKETDFVKPTSQLPLGISERMDTLTTCQVDTVDGRRAVKPVTLRDKKKASFVGWAANDVKETLPQEVFVKLYGPASVYFKAVPGLSRVDVSQAFKKPALENCGWEAYADLSELPSGTYYVQVIQVDGRNGTSCDTQRQIILT
ncbi:MAG: hypothetical protein KTQ49_04640 [Candidatus Omnitrophica bacterium]|nr:hypothetical protein [Candidatus Omnitrophota bacterium]